MRIIRIALYTEAGWILPSGEVKKVPAFNHVNYVRRHYKEFNLTKEDIIGCLSEEIKSEDAESLMKSKDAESLINLAGLNGAIRFSVNDIYGFAQTAPLGYSLNRKILNDIMMMNDVAQYKVDILDRPTKDVLLYE